MGFVRAYAEHPGLDGALVADRFKEEGKVHASRTPLVLPSPLPEGRIPSGAILLVAVVVLAVTYGSWVFVSSSDDEIAGMVPSLPERLASLVSSYEAEPLTPAKPDREEPPAATGTTPIPVAVKAAAPAPIEKSPTRLPKTKRRPSPKRDRPSRRRRPPRQKRRRRKSQTHKHQERIGYPASCVGDR